MMPSGLAVAAALLVSENKIACTGLCTSASWHCVEGAPRAPLLFEDFYAVLADGRKRDIFLSIVATGKFSMVL